MFTQREPPWPTQRCLEAMISLSSILGFIFRPGFFHHADDGGGAGDDDADDDKDVWRHGG